MEKVPQRMETEAGEDRTNQAQRNLATSYFERKEMDNYRKDNRYSPQPQGDDMDFMEEDDPFLQGEEGDWHLFGGNSYDGHNGGIPHRRKEVKSATSSATLYTGATSTHRLPLLTGKWRTSRSPVC